MRKIVNTDETRKRNQKLILDYIKDSGPLSSATIAKKLNVPAGTIARVTASLLDKKLLCVEKRKRINKVGKPPIMLNINKKFALIAGVELNELSTTVIITDFKGKILSKKNVKTLSILDDVSAALIDLIYSSIKAIGMSIGLLKSVGIGISGIMSRDGKYVVQGFLPDGYPIVDLLETKLKVPVFAGNDADFAVLAEKRFGAGKKYRNIVCLLDRGWLGMGIFLNNMLYEGCNKAAGELIADISNGIKNENIERFPFIASYGLEKNIRNLNFTDLYMKDFSSREEFIYNLANLAKNGNKKAIELLDLEVTSFAIAIARLLAVFNPDILVLAGDIVLAREVIEDKIYEEVKYLRKTYSNISTSDFKFSTLTQNEVTLGAVVVAIEEISNIKLNEK